MRRMFFGIALLSLAFAPAPLPRREVRQGDDVQRIRGSWLVTSIGREGRAGPGDNTRWVFAPDKTMQIVSGNSKYDWTYTIDPRATPKALDMSYGPNPLNRSYLKCLYVCEGDELRIGYNPSNWGTRPVSEKEAGYLMTFRRER